MIHDGITTWAPFYYTETFSVAASLSILMTAVMPVNKILAYVLWPMISRRVKDMRRAILGFYGGALACACAALEEIS